jgi:Fe-S cluster biosynthesis and repair protein YggX
MRNVFCQKYKKEMEGLEKPPYPGELGQKIYNNISKQAWTDRMEYQTKLINELKLKVFEPSAQATIKKHAEEFFFKNS